MNIICYYHKADLDGKCAAAIVKREYPDCELIGVDYPDKPDFEKIQPGDTVLVVDFSFEPGDMERLTNSCDLMWIDHHKSALENAKGRIYENDLGKREIGKAGCELTWEYLFPKEPMPEAVRLLGRYDVWDRKNIDWWEKYILPFQYGMKIMRCFPPDNIWEILLQNNAYSEKWLNVLLKKGTAILDYEEQQSAIYAEAMAFPVEFEGHKAWAINKALSNSKIFEKTFPDALKRPLWILFSYKAGVWKYSLYCFPLSGIDVSKIAVKYGGGGHAGAAGFQSEKYLLQEVS